MSQIAEDFGISQGCLPRWVRRAEIEDGQREGLTLAGEAENRELRKRNKLFEQERDPAPCGDLPGAGSQPKMIYPMVRDLASSGISMKVTCRVLGCSPQAFYKWAAAPVSQRDWDKPGEGPVPKGRST